MQSIVDWVLAHWGVLAVLVYELWSLVPDSVVKSSSVLTLIGGWISKLKPA